MRRTLMAVVLVLVAVACGGEVDPGSVQREPSAPASGPVVAGLVIAETVFHLHDEGAGCVAARVSYPGLQETVDRGCFGGENVMAPTDECGWLSGPEIAAMAVEADRPAPECDVNLPVAFFGKVVEPDIGWVCVPTLVDDEGSDWGGRVAAVRFLEIDEQGYILAAAEPGESQAAHLFTQTGLRYGEPPLDAPSGPIYAACEALAPWGAQSELSFIAELIVTLADDLQTDGIAFGFEAGTGAEAVSGGAFIDEDFIDLGVTVAASSRSLTVWTQNEDGVRLFEARYPWPAEFIAVLMSGEECGFANTMEVDIDSSFRYGNGDGLTVTWSGTECPSASGS